MGCRLTTTIYAMAAFWCLFHINSAVALEFKFDSYQNQRVLLARGEIVSGDAAKLRKRLSYNPQIQEVLFHSNGGLFKEGIELGEALRDLGRVTRIPRNGVCVSACVWAFMGGVLRFVDDDAKIGVHMATLIFNDEYISKIGKLLKDESKTPFDVRLRIIISRIEKGSARAAADKAEHLVRMGVSLRLLAPGLSTDQWEVYWLSRSEIRSYNIVNSD